MNEKMSDSPQPTRGKRRDALARLSPAQRQLADNGFNERSVADIAAKAGLPLDDAGVAKMTQVLERCRLMVGLETASAERKRARAKLAELLVELGPIIGEIRANSVEEYKFTLSGEALPANGPSYAPAILQGIFALDALAAAIGLVDGSAFLMHPELRIAGLASWQDFARPLRDEILKIEAAAPKAAIFRFVALVMPGITRQSVAFDRVGTFLKRERPTRRATRTL